MADVVAAVALVHEVRVTGTALPLGRGRPGVGGGDGSGEQGDSGQDGDGAAARAMHARYRNTRPAEEPPGTGVAGAAPAALLPAARGCWGQRATTDCHGAICSVTGRSLAPPSAGEPRGHRAHQGRTRIRRTDARLL